MNWRSPGILQTLLGVLRSPAAIVEWDLIPYTAIQVMRLKCPRARRQIWPMFAEK